MALCLTKQNMKFFFNILLLLSFIIQSFGCLNEGNEYNVNLRGQTFEEYQGFPVFYRSFDIEYSQNFISTIDLKYMDTINPILLADYAVHLTKLRKYKEALNLLEWLNEEYPDEYQITTNLGTLYELNGNVTLAQKFIKKGIELNQESHNGSEWFHVAVLAAKKKIETDPDWLLTNNVLNLNLTDTVEAYSDSQYDILYKIWDIEYQLKERIPFTPDKDLLIANILNELGDMLKLHVSIKNAYVAYRMALEYDPEDRYQIKAKLEDLLPTFKKFEFKESVFLEHFPPKEEYEERTSAVNWYWIWIIGIGVSILIGVIWMIKRK